MVVTQPESKSSCIFAGPTNYEFSRVADFLGANDRFCYFDFSIPLRSGHRTKKVKAIPALDILIDLFSGTFGGR
jgi:hypothetical protein